MIIDYVGVKEINGSLIVMDGVKGVSNEEIVDIRLDNGTMRQGRVVQIEGERIVVQVFEGTRRISLKNTRTRLTGHPMEMPLSPEIIGRVLDGAGKPIDGLGDIFPVKKANINGTPINPVSRVYPKNYINTGISTIDTLMTLIRGQKLPIFSGSGMKHNDLAVQIVRQAKISGANSSNFGVVFAAMGVQKDVADQRHHQEVRQGRLLRPHRQPEPRRDRRPLRLHQPDGGRAVQYGEHEERVHLLRVPRAPHPPDGHQWLERDTAGGRRSRSAAPGSAHYPQGIPPAHQHGGGAAGVLQDAGRPFYPPHRGRGPANGV